MAGKRVACDCGATVRAATDAELIAQVRAHAQQVHGMQLSDEQILAMLRGMQKSRRESVEMYRQGNRPELVAKEEAEIAAIDSFLPQQMDEAAIAAAVDAAIAEAGATSVKDMGKVMAALKKHGAALDMSKANPLVKAKLGG